MLVVTPQAANRTIGQAVSRKSSRGAVRDMVAYQEEVRDASRVAEVLNRVILRAKRLGAGADQFSVPPLYSCHRH